MISTSSDPYNFKNNKINSHLALDGSTVDLVVPLNLEYLILAGLKVLVYLFIFIILGECLFFFVLGHLTLRELIIIKKDVLQTPLLRNLI